MSQLQQWAEKVMREVTEGAPPARRIRLTSEAMVFETWEPVLSLNPAEWSAEAEALLIALADELPKRRIQMTFTAEDNAGGVLSQHLKSITGKNQAVQDLGTQNGAKALADALAQVVKTSDAVLAQARSMMEFQAQQLEKAHTQLHEYADLFQAVQKLSIEEGEQGNAVGKMLLTQLEQASPLAMQLMQHWMEQQHKTKLAAVAAGATNGSSTAGKAATS